MGKYCDNERLKVVINLYNKLNIYDTGDWCPGYLQRQEKQFQSNKMTAEEQNRIIEVIKRCFE